jgi:hypothetical protein
MSYSDFERKIAKPNGFALYLPPDASEARRIAQRKYEDAIIALASSEDEAHLSALAEVERAPELRRGPAPRGQAAPGRTSTRSRVPEKARSLQANQ